MGDNMCDFDKVRAIKKQEILNNMHYGNKSQDNMVIYRICYNDGSKLDYFDLINNESFSLNSFFLRLLYDISFSSDIKYIRIALTNKKYKDVVDSMPSHYSQKIDFDDKLLENIEKVRDFLKMYHYISIKEYMNQDNFTDYNYKLINSMIDIINSHSKFTYGYVVSIRKGKTPDNKIVNYYTHMICSLLSIKKTNNCHNLAGLAYIGNNHLDLFSKSYTIKSPSRYKYLKCHSFLNNSQTFLRHFPYLIDYILDLMNWKYINKQDEIPNYVYDQLKQKYMIEKDNKLKLK